MAGSSSSTQSSSGQSTSTSYPVQTPQSEWGLQLSQLLSALAGNQYNWAMQQFNNGMGVTQGNIQQYLDLAGRGAGLAQNLIEQYRDKFQPLMDQFIQQAATYNSEGRQRFEMGQAESTVAQASQAARDEAERRLQGFGINPNSGRYQDLMLTSRIQDAAARAGAGTKAALDVADRGRAMTQAAAQMGQNVPGMAVNALQSAYTGISGAENAILGMLNTGNALSQSAAPYFNASSGAIKQPLEAKQAQSTQQSKGQSSSVQVAPSQSGGSQRQPQQQQHSPSQSGNTGSNNPNAMGVPHTPQPTSRQNPYYQPPDASVRKVPDEGTGETDQQQGDIDRMPYPMVGTPNSSPFFDERGVITPFGDPNLGKMPDGSQFDFDGNNRGQISPQELISQIENQPTYQPQGGNWGEGTNDPGNVGPSWQYDPVAQGNYNPPTQWPDQQQQAFEPVASFDQNNFQPQQQPDYWNDTANDWNQNYDFSDFEQPQQQEPEQNYDDGSSFSDTSAYDTNYEPQQDYTGFEENYARGGPVRRRPASRGVVPTTGGAVPRGASPSRGRVTDDVPARLNAGEFVIPRDVTAHRGPDFFRNLIRQSRMARTGMAGPPARGKMKPSLPTMGRPTFRSRQMGA